jgi:hypothetical protein
MTHRTRQSVGAKPYVVRVRGAEAALVRKNGDHPKRGNWCYPILSSFIRRENPIERRALMPIDALQ